MNNGDYPAIPVGNGQVGMGDVNPMACGLTKREHIAAMAMQGYISAGSNGMPSSQEIVALAIKTADEMLAELEVGHE